VALTTVKPSTLLENTVIQGGYFVVGCDATLSSGYPPTL